MTALPAGIVENADGCHIDICNCTNGGLRHLEVARASLCAPAGFASGANLTRTPAFTSDLHGADRADRQTRVPLIFCDSQREYFQVEALGG